MKEVQNLRGCKFFLAQTKSLTVRSIFLFVSVKRWALSKTLKLTETKTILVNGSLEKSPLTCQKELQ